MKMCNYAIKMLTLLWLACWLTATDVPHDQTWSWQYSKTITKSNAEDPNTPTFFRKTAIDPFTQLIFSWNAVRPAVGSFVFYVSVRDADTKQWSPWHQMMQWGAAVQRSFRVQHTGQARYEHVRFELDRGKADGFCIKVVAQDNAPMTHLKALHVNVNDFSKFKKEHTQQVSGLRTIALNDVPRISQRELDHPRNAGLCSPTACTMLVSYLTKKEIDPVRFAEGAFDQGLDIYGSWPFNVAHAYEQSDGTVSFAASRLNSFKDLHSMLARGIPVVVSVRGDLTGAPKPYDNGHLLVVIGWDALSKAVICHDPAFETKDKMVARYPINSFLEAWERSRRLTYIAKPLSFRNT